MDNFTAPTAAWQSTMALGANVAGAGRGERCGGCDDDKPCDSCGGPAKATSPAQQALGWGLIQFGDRPGLDVFAKTAHIGQVVRDAPGRTDSVEWRSIISMIGASQDLINVQSSGRNATASISSLQRLDDSIINGLLAQRIKDPKTPGPGSHPGEQPSPPGWDDGNEWKRRKLKDPHFGQPGTDNPAIPSLMYVNGRCCVSSSEYPKNVTDELPVLDRTAVKPTQDPSTGRETHGGTTTIGFNYEMEASFIQDPPECFCACCMFAQYVLKSELKTDVLGRGGGPLPSTPSDPPEEDCCFALVNPATGGVVDFKSCDPDDPKPAIPASAPAGAHWELVCYGMRNPKPGVPIRGKGQGGDIYGPDPGGKGKTRQDGCVYSGDDRPTRQLRYSHNQMVHFDWTFLAVGIIWDVCHNVVRRMKMFNYHIAGVVRADSAGDPVFFTDPVGGDFSKPKGVVK